MMNPESIALGLLIDAISLDTCFLLVEIQVIALGGFIIQTRIKPLLIVINNLLLKLAPGYFIPTKNIIAKYPPILLHVVPGLVGVYWILITQVW